MKQSALFLHGALAAAQRGGGALHHGRASRPYVAPVHRRRFAGRNVKLAPVAPPGRAARALLQPRNVAPKILVARLLPGVLPVEALLPGVVIALHHPGVASVECQHMVHAAVEKGAVMADQQKAVLAPEIARHQLAPVRVQMVGRLVDQGIGILPRKQRAEQRLGLFAPAERAKGTFQRLLPNAQQLPFPQDLPLLRAGRRQPEHLQGRQGGVRHLIGKIYRLQREANRALKRHAPCHQAKQRGLASPVAADQPQPPAGVQIQVQMFKNGLAARIGKGKISDGQLHFRLLLSKRGRAKKRSKKEPSGCARLPWQSRPRLRGNPLAPSPSINA